MKKIVVCAMILGFSLIASSTSFAKTDSTASSSAMLGRRCVTRWEMFKFIRDLNITKAQVTAFEELKDATESLAQPVLEQITEQQDLLTNAFLAAEIDAAGAETHIDAMQALQTQLSDIMLHAELQAAQILTAEQRTLILDMVNKLKECEKSRPGWLSIKKPTYFSLIMPDKVLN